MPLLAWFLGLAAMRGTANRVHPRPDGETMLAAIPAVLKNRNGMLSIWAYTFHNWELLGLWAWLPAFLTAAVMASGASAGEAAALALSLSALTYVANIAGSIVGGTMADRWGRTQSILLWSCVSLVLSFSIGWMIAELRLPVRLGRDGDHLLRGGALMEGLLTIAILLPLATAFFLFIMPANRPQIIRALALFATGVSLLVILFIFAMFDRSLAGYQFVQGFAWLPALNINLRFGVDGISMTLLLRLGFVAFAGTLVAREIHDREKEYYILFLALTTGIMGTFTSLDLFFFYFCYELAVLPMYC